MNIVIEFFISQLKNSHIKAPLGKQMEFSTEHLDQFTDKDGKGRLQVDAGRLQKSSVPLGTLYTYWSDLWPLTSAISS